MTDRSSIQFSAYPGAHERRLQRHHNHPQLFTAPSAAAIAQAQQQDQQELEQFKQRFQQLINEAISLKPNESSEKILLLKESLDKAFEECSSLSGDQTPIKEAIIKLLQVIMRAVYNGAANDPKALQELEREEQARTMHFELQRLPLIADLLRPVAVIPETELVATLLSETQEQVQAAFQLFNPEQQHAICQEAAERIHQQQLPEVYQQRLADLEQWSLPEQQSQLH